MPYLREIIPDGHPTLRKVAKQGRPEGDSRSALPAADRRYVRDDVRCAGRRFGRAASQRSKRLFVIDVQRRRASARGRDQPEDRDRRGRGRIEARAASPCPAWSATSSRFERVAVSGLDRNGRRFGSKAKGCLRSACSTRSTISTASSTSTARRTPAAGQPTRRERNRGGVTSAVSSEPARSRFRACASSRRVPQLAGVVTQPDRPAGRGQQLHAEPGQARRARARRCACSSRRTCARLRARSPGERFDLLRARVVRAHSSAGSCSICRASARSTCIRRCLPHYRGATPIQTAIAQRRRETGVSIMLMDAGMDTGDIVVAAKRARSSRAKRTASCTIGLRRSARSCSATRSIAGAAR